MTITLPKPKREDAEEVVLARRDWERLRGALADAEEAAEQESDRRALVAARAENAAYEAALPHGRQATTPLAVVMAEIDGRHPLRAWREYRGMTQESLAVAAGVVRDMIAEIETGKHQGSLETLDRLGGALAVPIEALLSRGDDQGEMPSRREPHDA